MRKQPDSILKLKEGGRIAVAVEAFSMGVSLQ